jgi:hypothetical protein
LPGESSLVENISSDEFQELEQRQARLRQELEDTDRLLSAWTGSVRIKTEAKRGRIVSEAEGDDDNDAVFTGETRPAKRRITETVDLTGE